MKTCPYPKCKTTGIPGEAKFCPECGEVINLKKQYEETAPVVEEKEYYIV